MSINYLAAHREANTQFYKIDGEPYSKAVQYINQNLEQTDGMSAEEKELHTYVWECVRCKLNSSQKAKKNEKPEYMKVRFVG